MKDMAKLMRKALQVPRTREPEQTPMPQVEKGQPGEIPDTWGPEHHAARMRQHQKDLEKVQPLQKRLRRRRRRPSRYDKEKEVEQAPQQEKEERTTQAAPEHLGKKRNHQLSVCISEEEEWYIRQHVKAQGMGVSGWVRQVMFAEIGMEIPPRPHK